MIGLPITLRIGVGFRAFAEHIVGIGVTFCFQHPRLFQRQIHGLTQHELTAELLENLRQNRVNHGLADALNQTFERTEHALAALRIQYLFEQHQPTRGRIDQGAVRLALMRRPVALTHFVLE